MGYSQNGAAFFYWAHKRRKTADEARRVAGKVSSLSDGMVVFLFIVLCGLIGAAVHAFNYVMFHAARLISLTIDLLPLIP
ncbi:hypothetical protein TW83_18895 [Paracoccus sp. S4493]|uniref:hypothetical protein n=1 Tax=unclassified Paracoccus (in: a-proteobacteria) TaxID=2688777 RepID=UPI0005FA30F7|nr:MULTISPECIES: hypothetical protein [unclassified Paracoccus (in: a-proteobacteria)]KJZ21424.1 hypothetical protein TW83_18895 [Paracoccus sp. S4493]MCO6363686.1 hypothetical protein [Paracoccus sp. 08]